MTTHIWSAHEIGITRLCAAHECPHDAETGWALCRACETKRARGIIVELHVVPKQLEPTLRCSECNRWKVDQAFPLRATEGKASGGREADRRGRYYACLACMPKALAKREAEAQARLEREGTA